MSAQVLGHVAVGVLFLESCQPVSRAVLFALGHGRRGACLCSGAAPAVGWVCKRGFAFLPLGLEPEARELAGS